MMKKNRMNTKDSFGKQGIRKPNSTFQVNILGRQAVGDILHRTAKRLPDKTALVFREKRFTYEELNALANRTAHALMELRIKKGDTLSIMSQNCHQVAILMWACLKMGARYSPLNYLLKGREIIYQINHNDAKVLFVEDALLGEVRKVLQNLPMVQRFGLINLKGIELPKGWIDADDLMKDKYPATTPEVIIHDDDIASIIYTSGTTANPKGAMLQHKSYFSMAANANSPQYLNFQEDDVYLMNIPLYHVGASSIMVGLFYAGGTAIVTHGSEPMELLNLIQEEKVTLISWPPALYVALLKLPIYEFDLSSIKKMGFSGASAPMEVFRKWSAICPQALWRSNLTQTESNLHGMTGYYKKEPPAWNVVGKPAPGLEVKLVDEAGNEVPPGDPGEVLFRTPGVMLGYYKNEELTAETLRDGWLHTGDVLVKGEDGLYYFIDRVKDMIKTGGTNVSCVEVEEILKLHPDIEISAVFSAPHTYWGEGVVAAVVPKRESLSEAEVIEFAKDKLAGYKLPKKIVMLKQMELPVTPTGKIMKSVLRKKYQNIFEDSKGK